MYSTVHTLHTYQARCMFQKLPDRISLISVTRQPLTEFHPNLRSEPSVTIVTWTSWLRPHRLLWGSLGPEALPVLVQSKNSKRQRTKNISQDRSRLNRRKVTETEKPFSMRNLREAELLTRHNHWDLDRAGGHLAVHLHMLFYQRFKFTAG